MSEFKDRVESMYPQFKDRVRMVGSPQVAVLDLGDPGRITTLGCETCLDGLSAGDGHFPNGLRPLPITAISADAVDHPARDMVFVCPTCGRLGRYDPKEG